MEVANVPAPDRKGFYRCPFGCHSDHSPYPPPKWKTVAGIQKHMASCFMAPPPEYIRPPDPEQIFFGDCATCSYAVFEGETIWVFAAGWCCYTCRVDRTVTAEGYLYCAGLVLAGLEDIVG